MERTTNAVLAAVIGGLVAAMATPVAGATGGDAGAALAATLDAEEAALRPQRRAFRQYFREAYARYPAIPAGTLEAIAYVQSRWLHLRPDHGQGQAHHHMPGAHGVMGLYAGDGFADQVGDGARLLGIDASRVRGDARSNVMAAAALLERDIRQLGAGRTPEAIRPALMRYAGFSPSPADAARDSAIGDHARASFAYDVLLAMDRGVDDRGIVVQARAIAWEQAFDIDQLVRLRAPFVRLDVAGDRIETDTFELDPRSETLRRRDGAGAQSTDYGPALWNPASSSNYTASRSAAVSAVTLHTAQGSYAGTISWFRNPSANVSAHYVIRSSDGQVTQMVRHAHTAWHVRNQNGYTLGIEHEGYVDNSSWYTTSMYAASAALVRSFCAGYAAIDCSTAYRGAPGSGINVLPASVDIKGHQHFSGQTHTDPGINWNWSGYYTRLNPGGGGTTRILDSFESSVGHFNTTPAYSGSTAGIAASSSATRDCATRRNGSCSLRVLLKDDPATSAAWSVRLLSGAGAPGSNVALTRANGSVGFWVYAGGSGMSVGVGIDDSDGTERSTSRPLAANAWTWVSWSLADAAHWNAWAGGNGAITAGTVHLDAVWLYRAQTAYDVNVYLDDVQASH